MATGNDEFERLVQLEMERLRSQLGMKPPIGSSSSSSNTGPSSSSSAVSQSSSSLSTNLYGYESNDTSSSFQAAANLDHPRPSYGSSVLDTTNRNRPTVVPPVNYPSDTGYPPLSSGSNHSNSLSVSSTASSSSLSAARAPLPLHPSTTKGTTKDSLSIYQKQMSGSAMADLLPVGGVDVSPPMDGLSASSFFPNSGTTNGLRSPLRSSHTKQSQPPVSLPVSVPSRYPHDTENQPPDFPYPPPPSKYSSSSSAVASLSSSRRYSLGQSSLPLPGEGGSIGVGAQPTYRYIPPPSDPYPVSAPVSRTRVEHSPPPFRPDPYRSSVPPSLPSSTVPSVQEQLALEKANRAAQYAEELKQQMAEAAERKRLQKLADEEYERGISNQVPQLPGIGGTVVDNSFPATTKATKHIQFQDPLPPSVTDLQAPLSPHAGSLSPRSRLLTNRDGSLPPSARSPQYREVGGNMDAESVREAVLRGEKMYRFRFQTRTQEELDKLASRQRAQTEQALELERQIEERRRQKEEETRLEKLREAEEERRVQKELQELARKESAEADRPPAPTEILPVHMHNNLGTNGGGNGIAVAVPSTKHTSHDDRATGPTAFIKSPVKGEANNGKNSGPLPPSAARLLQIRQKVAQARDPSFYTSLANRGTAVSPPPVGQSLPLPPPQPSQTNTTILHEPYEQSAGTYHSRESSLEPPPYENSQDHRLPRSGSLDRDTSLYADNGKTSVGHLNNFLRRSNAHDDHGSSGSSSDSISELVRVRRNQEELTKRLEEQNTIMARMQTALRGMYGGPSNPLDNHYALDPRASYGSMGSFGNHPSLPPHGFGGGTMDASFLPSSSQALPPHANGGLYGVGMFPPSANPYLPYPNAMNHGFPLYNGGELPGTTSVITASGHGNRDGNNPFFTHNDNSILNPYVSYPSHAKSYNGMDDSLFAAAAALDQPGVNQSYLSLIPNGVRPNGFGGGGRTSVNGLPGTGTNPPAPLVMKPIMGGAALPSNNIPGGPDGNDLSIRWVGKGRPMTAVPPKQQPVQPSSNGGGNDKPKEGSFSEPSNTLGNGTHSHQHPTDGSTKHDTSLPSSSVTPGVETTNATYPSAYPQPPLPSSRATTRGRESSARRHRAEEYASAVESSRKLLASRGSLNVSSDSINPPSRLNSANVMRIPGVYGNGEEATEMTNPVTGLPFNGRPPTGPRRRDTGNTLSNGIPARTSTGQSGRGPVEASLDSSTLLVYVDGLRRNANGDPSSRPITGELTSRSHTHAHPAPSSLLASPTRNGNTTMSPLSADTSTNSSLGLILPSHTGNPSHTSSSAAFHPYASPKAYPKDKHHGSFSSPASEAAAILQAGGVHSQMTNYFDALARDEAMFAEADQDGLPVAFGVPRNEEGNRPRYYPPHQYVTHPAQNTHMYNNFPPPSKDEETSAVPQAHAVIHRSQSSSTTGVTATLYTNADGHPNIHHPRNDERSTDGPKANDTHRTVGNESTNDTNNANAPLDTTPRHLPSHGTTERTMDEGSDAEVSPRDKSQEDSPGLSYAYNAHPNGSSSHTPVPLHMQTSSGGTPILSPLNAQLPYTNPSLVSPASRSSTRTSSSPIRSVRPTSAAVRVGSARSNAPPSKTSSAAMVNLSSNNSSRPQSSAQTSSVARPFANDSNGSGVGGGGTNTNNSSTNGQSPYNISIAEIQAALQTDNLNTTGGTGGGTPTSGTTSIAFPLNNENTSSSSNGGVTGTNGSNGSSTVNRSAVMNNGGNSTNGTVLTNTNNSSPVHNHIIVEEHEGEIDAEGEENENEVPPPLPEMDTTINSSDMTTNIEFKDLQASFAPPPSTHTSTVHTDDQSIVVPPYTNNRTSPSISPTVPYANDRRSKDEGEGDGEGARSQKPSPLANGHPPYPSSDFLGATASTTDSPRLSPVDKALLMDRVSPVPGSLSRSQSRASGAIINTIPRSRRSTTASPTNLDASVTSIGSNTSTMSITAAALADTSGKYVRRQSWGLGPDDISIHKRQLFAFYSTHAPQKATEENIETAWELFGPRVWEELRRKYKEKVLSFSPVPLPENSGTSNTANNSRANSRPGTGYGLSPTNTNGRGGDGLTVNESKLAEE